MYLMTVMTIYSLKKLSPKQNISERSYSIFKTSLSSLNMEQKVHDCPCDDLWKIFVIEGVN